jgi:hypothetical protein
MDTKESEHIDIKTVTSPAFNEDLNNRSGSAFNLQGGYSQEQDQVVDMNGAT